MRALRKGPALQAEQIDEEAIGTRHAGGELPEKAESRVYVRPATQRRDEQATLQLDLGIRRRIVRLEQRDVRRIPCVREIETALLHPATPIIGTDGIRIMKDRIRRIELRHGRGLVRHAIVWTRDRQGIRGKAAI